MALLYHSTHNHGANLRDAGLKNRALAHAIKHLGIKEAALRFGISEEALRPFVTGTGISPKAGG